MQGQPPQFIMQILGQRDDACDDNSNSDSSEIMIITSVVSA